MKLRGRLKPEGALYLVYLTLYAFWRLGVDFIRQGTPFFWGFMKPQVISLIILTITIPLLVMRVRSIKVELGKV